MFTVFSRIGPDMNNENNAPAPLVVSKPIKHYVAALAMLAVFGATDALAFEVGHSRVISSPGQPLVVQVPILDMSSQEAASLKVSVAPPSAWQASGLKPPVPLDSFVLSVVPGRNDESRLVQLRSTQSTQSTVVDVLLSVSTSAASRTVQASVIVPPPPKVRLAGEQITVQRGDTLIGIAEQFPVSGANLYQQLWALYSSNPKAFLRENMNLLKAGAALRIPDADDVRAVDPAFAKAQYLAHVRAFRQSRGVSQGNQGIAAQAPAQIVQTPPAQQQGAVEQERPEPPPPANDQVRLTAAGQDAQGGQSAQADAQTARDKAVADERERKQALEQNISALQGAIAASSGTTGSSVSGPASTAENGGVASPAPKEGQLPNGASGQSGSEASAGSLTAQSNTAAPTSSSDAGGPSAGGAASPADSGASTATANATGASDVSSNGKSEATASANSAQKGASSSSASGQSPAADVSAGVFTRISKWVSDNTTAAIALLLALIALILAWALRSSKANPSGTDAPEPRGQQPSTDFEKKLKEIDLSLDEKPQAEANKSDNKG